jgi:hypothetical protein
MSFYPPLFLYVSVGWLYASEWEREMMLYDDTWASIWLSESKHCSLFSSVVIAAGLLSLSVSWKISCLSALSLTLSLSVFLYFIFTVCALLFHIAHGISNEQLRMRWKSGIYNMYVKRLFPTNDFIIISSFVWYIHRTLSHSLTHSILYKF